jgi:ribosomal protein L11 methyltransferase
VAWLELTLRLPAEDYAGIEPVLELAGALSIAITDDGNAPILEPEPGTTPLWPTVTARALFDEVVDQRALAALLEPIVDGEVNFETISDESVHRAAREPIRPVDIGPRLAIVPAEAMGEADDRSLGLHMGLAFGTGQHPTTRLCLEWLEREMPPGLRVLDYGTGSGVLALAALKLGAVNATAVDNEPQALTAARRNAALNGMQDSIHIGPPESLESEAFDLVCANILAGPLIELADSFAACQPAGGRIVLSGILSSQIEVVAARYRSAYGALERHLLSDWALLTGTRRSEYDR